MFLISLYAIQGVKSSLQCAVKETVTRIRDIRDVGALHGIRIRFKEIGFSIQHFDVFLHYERAQHLRGGQEQSLSFELSSSRFRGAVVRERACIARYHFWFCTEILFGWFRG